METEMLPVFVDEDAIASQILEIIGGITPKALQTTLEESYKESDAWSMEEGDDSVFYSDEDTPQHGDTVDPRRTVPSEAEETPLEDEEDITETVHQDTAQEDHVRPEKEKLEDVNPSRAISDTILSTDEDDHLKNTESAAQSSSQDRIHHPPSPKHSKEPEASPQLSGVHRPPLVVYRKFEERPSDPKGDSEEPSETQVRSIQTLSKKKSSHPKSFNHLTSSKYSTLSYRRIRRGNTRQKIEEFEYLITHF